MSTFTLEIMGGILFPTVPFDGPPVKRSKNATGDLKFTRALPTLVIGNEKSATYELAYTDGTTQLAAVTPVMVLSSENPAKHWLSSRLVQGRRPKWDGTDEKVTLELGVKFRDHNLYEDINRFLVLDLEEVASGQESYAGKYQLENFDYPLAVFKLEVPDSFRLYGENPAKTNFVPVPLPGGKTLSKITVKTAGTPGQGDEGYGWPPKP